MNFLKSWWYKRQRKIDMEILWPACLKLTMDLDHAKAAFAVHALIDRAWMCLGTYEVQRIIDELTEEEVDQEIVFEHHTIRIVYGEKRVIVELWDGTTAHACPQDTPEYLAYAREVGADNIDTQCIQHDVAHAIFGEMLGGESPVLAHVARGTEFPQEQLDSEEAIVKLLQKYFNKYQWPSDVCISATDLQEVMSGAHFTDHSKV